MKIKWTIGIILTLLVSSQGQSDRDQRIIWMSGNRLAANCEHLTNCQRGGACTDDDSVRAGTCMGYIKGVSDAAPGVCIPRGTEARQIIEIVIQRMNKNPDLLKGERGEMYMASAIVGDALRTAYPCVSQKHR